MAFALGIAVGGGVDLAITFVADRQSHLSGPSDILAVLAAGAIFLMVASFVATFVYVVALVLVTVPLGRPKPRPAWRSFVAGVCYAIGWLVVDVAVPPQLARPYPFVAPLVLAACVLWLESPLGVRPPAR